MAPAILAWAAAPVAPPPRPEYALPFLRAAWPLMVALLVGALIIYLVDRWRRRPPQPAAEANDQLAHFRSLYERGEMTREEFDNVKARLTGQLRRELNVPPPAAPPKPAEGTPAEPPPG